MKKKILGSLAVLTIAVVAAFNVNVNVSKDGLSDISLNNIEALANYEGGSGLAYKRCATSVSGQQGEPGLTHVTYCASCGPVLSKSTTLNSTCN